MKKRKMAEFVFTKQEARKRIKELEALDKKFPASRGKRKYKFVKRTAYDIVY